jgi:hypothetical protein
MENLDKPVLFLLRWQFCLLLVLVLSLIGQARATTYATWVMIWYGHDQASWNANAPDALKNQIHGQWKTLDWADKWVSVQLPRMFLISFIVLS